MSLIKKKLWGVCLIFSLILLLSAGVALADEWVEYSNQYFSVEYPAHWEVVDYLDSSFSEIYFYDDYSDLVFVIELIELGFGPLFGATADPEMGEDEFIEEFRALIEGQMGFMQSGVEILSKNEIMIDDLKALEFVMKEDEGSYLVESIYDELDWLAVDGLEKVIDYLEDYQKEEFIELVDEEELEYIKEFLLDTRIRDLGPYITSYDIEFLIDDIERILDSQNLEFIYKTKSIATLYENQKLFITYEGDESEYEQMLGTIQRVIDSIQFAN